MYMYLVSAVRVLYIKAFVIFKYRLIRRLHKYLIGLKSIWCMICYVSLEWHLQAPKAARTRGPIHSTVAHHRILLCTSTHLEKLLFSLLSIQPRASPIANSCLFESHLIPILSNHPFQPTNQPPPLYRKLPAPPSRHAHDLSESTNSQYVHAQRYRDT